MRSIIDVKWQGDAFSGTLFDFGSSSVKRFTFNTRNLVIQVADAGPTTWSAANDKAQTGPESYWILYKQFRHNWPTVVFWGLVLLGEGCIAWIIWKAGQTAAQSSPVTMV